MIFVIAFVAGIVFALGLVLGGMTQPARVSGFLDFFGSWDPSLMLVMGGAVAVAFLGQRIASRLRGPIWAESFPLVARQAIDSRLLVGATLFGVGWGISGLCPGPALATLGALGRNVLVFVPAMSLGMVLFELWDRRKGAPTADETGKPLRNIEATGLSERHPLG